MTSPRCPRCAPTHPPPHPTSLLREAAQIFLIPGKTRRDVIAFLRSRGKSYSAARALAGQANKLARQISRQVQ